MLPVIDRRQIASAFSEGLALCVPARWLWVLTCAFWLCGTGRLSAQQFDQPAARDVMAIAADSISTWLRFSGRAHLYVVEAVTCDSTAPCTPELRNLARDVFAATAIATVVRPGQRWPTLCDNSDEIRVAVPLIVGDTARVRIVSVHAVRNSTAQEGLAHSLLLLRAGPRWNVITYDTVAVEVEQRSQLQPVWCSWSPEASEAGTRSAADAPRIPGLMPIAINSEEACSWCRITSGPQHRLGQGADLFLPGAEARVFTNGRGRYFAQNSSATSLLVYDSLGTFSSIIGTRGEQPAEFGRAELVAFDNFDSTYVLDNERRRISVLDPDLALTREISLPWRVDALHVLRDGRLLTLRTPPRDGDPVAIHRATGEVIRTFGNPAGVSNNPCAACGTPLVAISTNGYRIWLAWSARYRIEEWDLGGRLIAVIENPARTFGPGAGAAAADRGIAPDSTFRSQPGLKRLHMATDGSLWIGYTALDQLRQPVEAVDILDPVRARLVKSIQGFSTLDLVNENTRVIRRADVYGLPEVIVERIELDRRRDDGQRQPVPPRAP